MQHHLCSPWHCLVNFVLFPFLPHRLDIEELPSVTNTAESLILHSHAICWELTNRKPITMVRQTAKRAQHPDVLTTLGSHRIAERTPRAKPHCCIRGRGNWTQSQRTAGTEVVGR